MSPVSDEASGPGSPGAEDLGPGTALDRIRVRHFALWAIGAFLVAVTFLVTTGAEVGNDVSARGLGMGIVAFAAGGWTIQMVGWQGLSVSAVVGPVPTRWPPWGLVLLGVLALDLFESAEFHLLLPWLKEVAPALADRYTMNVVEEPFGMGAYLRLIGSGVIAAALVEEVLWRGLIYQRWAHAWSAPVGALIAAALPFALMHGHVPGAFVFAVVTTLLYLRTRSLWVPIAVHALGNGINLFGGLPVEDGFITVTGVTNEWIFGSVCFVAATGLLILIVRLCGGALCKPVPYVEHEKAAPTNAASLVRSE
jgi:hypothetical protein